MYSYQTLTDASHGQAWFPTKKRAKGMQREAMTKDRHEQFKAQLDQPEETYVVNRRIGSKLHQLYGIEVWTWTLTLCPLNTRSHNNASL